MKRLIKVLKFIFVIPVTATLLLLINIGVFNLLSWFVALSSFKQWLFGSIIFCIGGLICSFVMFWVSRLFKVGKINGYIISLLIVIDGILWIVDFWSLKHVSESLEITGGICVAVYFLCKGAILASIDDSFSNSLS